MVTCYQATAFWEAGATVVVLSSAVASACSGGTASESAPREASELVREIWASATPRRIALAMPKVRAVSSSNGSGKIASAPRAPALPRKPQSVGVPTHLPEIGRARASVLSRGGKHHEFRSEL